jgi:tetratricopeptide (TPR) repeat protein/O-antigen ligase
MQAADEELNAGPSSNQQRRPHLARELAVTLVLVYFTLVGGAIPSTSNFPAVMVSHLITMAMLIGWTVQRFLRRLWLPRTPLDLPLLVFYVLNVISTSVSAEPRLSLESLLHLTLFILAYYFVVDLLTSGWPVSRLVQTMLTVGSVVIAVELVELGLLLALWHQLFGQLPLLLALENLRQRVIMGPVNVLAWYMVILMPLAIARILMSDTRKARVIMGAWAIGNLLIFTSTLSRSGFMAMAVALAAFAVLALLARFGLPHKPLVPYLRRPAVTAGILLVISAAVILSTFTMWLVPARVGTISVRLELWKAAAEIIANRPAFGGGPGTFGYLFHQVKDFDPFATDLFHSHAHNGYLNVAAETGLPSLLAGGWLITVLVKTGWRGMDSGRPPAALGDTSWSSAQLLTSACLAVIAGLLVTMAFDVLWGSPLITLHAILLAAIIVAPFSQPRRLAPGPVRWLTLLAVAVLASSLIWIDSAHFFQYRAIEGIDDDNVPAGIQALQRAISIDPYLALYRFQLGVAQGYLSLEEHDIKVLGQAIAAFEAEISQGGDTAINNANLAWLEWRVGDPEGALNHMGRAVTLAPGRAYYQWGLGFLLEDIGDSKAATGAYVKAMEIEPALIDSGFWQASVYRRSIKADLLASGEVPPLTLATMAYFAGDYPEAIQLLDSVPQSASSYCLRGRTETEQGNYSAALEHLNAALEMAITNPTAYLARGELYLRMGEDSKAEHDLRIARFLGVEQAEIMLGEVAYHAGDIDHAIALYRRGIPGCHTLEPPYYAPLVYHRSNLVADFWPDSIVCAPYDSLVPEYLHAASAYREAGESEQADDLCHWLTSFYDPASLGQLDQANDMPRACPQELQDTRMPAGSRDR